MPVLWAVSPPSPSLCTIKSNRSRWGTAELFNGIEPLERLCGLRASWGISFGSGTKGLSAYCVARAVIAIIKMGRVVAALQKGMIKRAPSLSLLVNSGGVCRHHDGLSA